MSTEHISAIDGNQYSAQRAHDFGESTVDDRLAFHIACERHYLRNEAGTIYYQGKAEPQDYYTAHAALGHRNKWYIKKQTGELESCNATLNPEIFFDRFGTPVLLRLHIFLKGTSLGAQATLAANPDLK